MMDDSTATAALEKKAIAASTRLRLTEFGVVIVTDRPLVTANVLLTGALQRVRWS